MKQSNFCRPLEQVLTHAHGHHMLADHMINPDPSWLKGTQLFLMYKTTKKPVVDNTQDESRKHEVTVNPPHTHTNKTAYNGAFSQ